jgi:hypothetical protein
VSLSAMACRRRCRMAKRSCVVVQHMATVSLPTAYVALCPRAVRLENGKARLCKKAVGNGPLTDKTWGWAQGSRFHPAALCLTC